ncbi:hypothetical protein MRQ36_29025 [Micromonospora sp. R77]|nr:hypothetical protein [Micromonospora sp. R77]
MPLQDLSPIRVARREALLGLGVTDRAFGYPLELLIRAAAAGWRILSGTSRTRRGPPAPAPGLRLGTRHPPRHPGLRRRAAQRGRPPVTVLLVVAKAPVPGAVKTRLCPPATPDRAARIAAAALRDTVDAVAATPGVTPVLALAGRLADGVDATALTTATAGWTVLPQRGAGLAQRLAYAHTDVADAFPGGRCSRSAWTPRSSPRRCWPTPYAGWPTPTRCWAGPPTAAGGRWACVTPGGPPC